MKSNQVQFGKTQRHVNAAGTKILKYSKEIYHEGLKEHKLVSAPDPDILENKVELQVQKWDDKWSKFDEKRKIQEQKESNIEEANNRTMDANEAINQIENLLLYTLSIDDTVDWETLKKVDEFKDEKPLKSQKKDYQILPEKPEKSWKQFTPVYSIFDKLFKSMKDKKNKKYEHKLSEALEKWQKKNDEITAYNKKVNTEYENLLTKWEKDMIDWEKRKEDHYLKQNKYNTKIDQMKEAYLNKSESSIVEYCEMVLNNSKYPDSFPQSFELEYNPENKILVVEYELPSIDCFPKLKELKYIAAKKELIETYLSDTIMNKMFDDAIYKIALRTIHELFEADTIGALEAISFNGWVSAINRATGKEETNCIISLQTKKDEFIEIDLSRVDPKTCFRNLKGVASSKLSTLTPIQPILQISKTDKRFVEGYAVVGDLDQSTNLAAMDWEDFEHLIREIFEKEFSVNGGEVKVTQASRDGGVDAIAFDPDPIRGGKIVIQAKRYTNTVGVSAVRDLYGTVVNEGATKGILVTTATYGADAYDFAKGKPLTLLNGSNLLNLLEKHGHHAKIDLREAKKILSEME